MDANNFTFGQLGNFTIHIPTPPPDAELTNLNWVAGAPVPMQNPVSPTRKGAVFRNRHPLKDELKTNCAGAAPSTKTPKLSSACPQESDGTGYCSSKATQSTATPPHQPKREALKKDRTKDDKVSSKCCKDRAKDAAGGESKAKKPNCSYTSLIGLALMASDEGCLPVSEIYTYIEDEFPYFRSAPDGWKNSIRHNLSLNPAFRKVKDSMRWQGKKGFYWEVTPERRSSVEREVERYLRQEGKLRDMDQIDGTRGTGPFPSCLHASIPTMPQTPSRPLYQFQFCTGTQPYYDIASSMQRHYPPPPPSLPPPPIPSPPSDDKHTANSDMLKNPPTTTGTVTVLDTNMSPGQFAGFTDPTTSSANTALHDLFGLQLPSPKPLLTGCHCSMYTQPPLEMQVVDSAQYMSPCVCTSTVSSLPLPDVSSYMTSNSRTTRLRKQALDQLTIPKEQSIHTKHSTISESMHASSRFLQSSELLDRCMTLEDCFGLEDDYGSSGTIEYCGELPLPPSAHVRMGREEERCGMSVKPYKQEANKSHAQPINLKVTEGIVSSESSPMELTSDGQAVSEGCMRSKTLGERRRRKRRVSSARQLISQRGPVGTNRNSSQESEEKGTEKQGKDQGREEDEGEDMLSHVYSDSEETMRATLFTGVLHTTCTIQRPPENRAVHLCMVEDGVYSPPPENPETIFIQSQPRYAVY